MSFLLWIYLLTRVFIKPIFCWSHASLRTFVIFLVFLVFSRLHRSSLIFAKYSRYSRYLFTKIDASSAKVLDLDWVYGLEFMGIGDRAVPQGTLLKSLCYWHKAPVGIEGAEAFLLYTSTSKKFPKRKMLQLCSLWYFSSCSWEQLH